MTAIHDTSRDVLRVEEGSLYPALHRMEEDGWIRAEWVTKETGRRARVYELTAAGKKQLVSEGSRWHALTAAVNSGFRTVWYVILVSHCECGPPGAVEPRYRKGT